MNRRMVLEIGVFVLLVAAGATARIYFRSLPNFAPIAALALFAGYFFRSHLVAMLAPLTAMTASDTVLGGYEWQMMLVVYGMLTLPVAFRTVLRKHLRIERGHVSRNLSAVGGLLGCSLASSVLFFLATNFAWWPWTEMYEHSFAGLMHCYAQGLPFFRYTLMGDLFFAVVLFGGYALAVNLGWIAALSGQNKTLAVEAI